MPPNPISAMTTASTASTESTESTHRIVLAINPASGQGRGSRAGAIAQERLAATGYDVQVLIGTDAADLTRQLQHALAPAGRDRAAGGASAGDGTPVRPAALVVAGGDGMVQLGVSALAATGWAVPLGIVPAGTGNDVARALGLAVGDWARAADDAASGLASGAAGGAASSPASDDPGDGPGGGRIRRVDVVRCTASDGAEHWFTGVLGAGFDAIVNERANHWSWPRGRARYVLAMLRELPVFAPRSYTLTLDGTEWATRAMLVAVANAPSYGGGMRVCPDAQLDDGLLDVLVVRPLSRPAFLAIFPRVYSGTHVRDRRVEIRRAREVTVAAGGIVGYADGERLASLPLHCEVVPGALRVLCSGGTR